MTENINFTPGNLFTSETPFISTFKALIALTVDQFYKQIFMGELHPRQVKEITGDGPFSSGNLWDLIQKLGLLIYTAPDGIDWEDKEHYPPDPYDLELPGFVIIGRDNFDEDLLTDFIKYYRNEDGTIYYSFVSQEDFFNYWLFGIETNYTPDDPRIENHPGLKFLASISEHTWPWPRTDPFPDTGNMDDIDFDREHILKSHYGYTVAKKPGLSEKQRQKILDMAVREGKLSLQEIVEHIARLVRSRKLMQNNDLGRNLGSAIHKWETDLAYLKKSYYQKQFKWPTTRARSW